MCVCVCVLLLPQEAILAKGSFTIAIAGGSLVSMLGAMSEMKSVDWAKWHVAWVDERCVAHDDPASNYGAARDAWLSKVQQQQQRTHARTHTHTHTRFRPKPVF